MASVLDKNKSRAKVGIQFPRFIKVGWKELLRHALYEELEESKRYIHRHAHLSILNRMIKMKISLIAHIVTVLSFLHPLFRYSDEQFKIDVELEWIRGRFPEAPNLLRQQQLRIRVSLVKSVV
ncbi:hypothetical protein L596_020083 [Steinernema carpocapsae]|uniref:Uncharacterized protein n=1 Tax=Steinernema carpocapsae TaxID=34508 RepID=A0A4U5MSJ5_STECR|nr:hypothetical protein L596_020083 [Steinernema carpocapsae]